MIIKSEEFKIAMFAVRDRIAEAKRRGTHRGFIDYEGCLTVCHELIDILEDAGKAAERGECAYAYSVAALILVNCAKLASYADDSAGGITDTRSWVVEVLAKACSHVEYGSAEAEFIFLQSLKDSRNKAFEYWEEFAYDLLLATARLATSRNINKLNAVLEAFSASLSPKEYCSWHLESNSLVRLAAITVVEGEVAADNFIANNLQYDGILRIAIQKAISKGDYRAAEVLCHNKINSSSDRNYYWTREWYEFLFEIYLKMEDTAKQIGLAVDLLVYKHDIKYYDVLKKLLRESGAWETEYPSLLERLEQNLPYNLYMQILSTEGELSRLLTVVSAHPSSVFDYGEQLSVEFPQATYELCLEEIRSQAVETGNRRKYRQICDNIKRLFVYGAVAETYGIIDELKAKYPRRSAMLDELQGLQIRLARKQK